MACFLKYQIELKEANLHWENNEAISQKLEEGMPDTIAQFWYLCHCSPAELWSYPSVPSRDWWCHGYWFNNQTRAGEIYYGPFILNAILPVLASLSRQFQDANFHFSMIRTAVNWTIFSLEALEETNEPLKKLKAGIDSFTDISDELKWGKDTGTQLETLQTNYIRALISRWYKFILFQS